MVRWCTTCEDASGVTISVHLELQNISIHTHHLPEQDETGRIQMTRAETRMLLI
jgi:hypothetical protein